MHSGLRVAAELGVELAAAAAVPDSSEPELPELDVHTSRIIERMVCDFSSDDEAQHHRTGERGSCLLRGCHAPPASSALLPELRRRPLIL